MGLEFFSLSGAPITFMLEPGGDGRLAVIAGQGGSPDRVAWIRHAAGSSMLHVVTEPFGVSGPIPLGNVVGRPSSGDWDGDGAGDLAVLLEDFSAGRVLLDHNGLLTPAHAEDMLLFDGMPGALAGACPLLHDMDHDGAVLRATVPYAFLPAPGTALWLGLRRDRCFVFPCAAQSKVASPFAAE